MVQPLYKAKRPLFSCEIMMSVVAQIRKSLTEHTEPASPPKSGHDADIAVDPSWAMTGHQAVVWGGSLSYSVDSGAPPFPRCDLVNKAAAICGVLSMALTIDRKCGRRARPRVVS
jgi:hypothetical protein